MKGKWKEASVQIRALICVVCALLAGIVVAAFALDADSDGMTDDYERFFGVNYTTTNGLPALNTNYANDAVLDYDLDGLVNSNEFLKNTDVFAPDTDHDGFSDNADSNATSRMWVALGEEFWLLSLTNDTYDTTYAQPAWVVDAFKLDGTWQTNPAAFHVDSTNTAGVGAIMLEVDRATLTNDVVLSLDLEDHAGSSLYVDLWDTNAVVVASNVVGDLIGGTDVRITVKETIPLATYSDAVTIAITRGSGEITLYSASLYIDQDGDGLDADQEDQLGTSDSDSDSDNDGLSDHAEHFTHTTDPLDTDSDDDGLSDGDEVNTHSSNPLLTDTDSDGISDGLEVELGKDPATSNSYSTLPFVELFETNTVQVGDIDGQNNWEGSGSNSAMVQTDTVYAGAQALSLVGSASNAFVSASHIFATPEGNVVWADFYTKAGSRPTPTNTPLEDSVVFFFNSEGYIEAYDGSQPSGQRWVVLTNMTPVNVSTGDWVRLTAKIDYNAEEWLICVNGEFVAGSLGFADTRESFVQATLEGEDGFLDNFTVSTNVPDGVDGDADGIPDDWEITHFGDITRDGSGDYDSDGLTDLGEYLAGTDPDDSDSDDDALPDGWEIDNGTDPKVDDASADPDDDNLTNLQEYQNDTDPLSSDTDGDGMPDGWELDSGLDPTVSSDASLDPDSDGLTNLEEYQAGTDIGDSDTDGDGISDGVEVDLGKSPAISNSYNTLPFVEMFETNTVSIGDLSTQNGWDVSVTNAVAVQTSTVYEGNQAVELDLSMNTVTNTATIQQVLATDSAQFVWTDFYTKPLSRVDPVESNLVGVAATMFFDAEQRLVVHDGALTGTNAWISTAHRAVSEDDWVRMTIGLDYGSKEWTVFVNGVQVASGLTFADTNIQCLSAMTVEGGTALMDGITVATNQPAGLSFDTDSDGIPDDWEITHFGDLTRDGSGDYDSDGLTDLGEYLAGADPDDWDSDDDGMPDEWEVAHALDPLSDDSAGDADSDGLSNLLEYQQGSDPNDKDTDDDGMPDQWEYDNNLQVMTDDSAGDADSDGLSNLGEYQAGTDPNNADTDADGMPDGWEVANSLDPLSASDASADLDGDRLDNLGEYNAGTDINDSDSDDDGLSDYIEVTQVHSDPLTADFDGTVTDVSSVDGSSATNWLGSWTTEGTYIYARERSGYVDYSLSIPSNGVYAVAVEVTQHNPLTSQSEFDLELYVDGTYSGRQTVNAPYGSTAEALYFLPELDAGTYSMRVRWRNLNANTFLQINSVTLRTYGGTDSNTNGVADWIENREGNVSSIAAPPATSIVSPICLEGESEYQDMLSVTADYIPEGQTQQVITVMHGIRDGWYANVLLSPSNATSVQVTDQNGAISYSNSITWSELNIIENVYSNGLSLRDDSSLLLVAYPEGETNGTMTIEVLDESMTVLTNVVKSVGSSFEYLFDSAGSYTVSGTYSNGATVTNQTLDVDVVSASFPLDEIVCVASVAREINCPSIPTNGVVIEYDPALEVDSSVPLTGGVDLEILNRYDVPLYMVARLGEDGPILDNAKISTVYGDRGDYWRVVENYADGSRLVMVSLQLGYVPSDLEVKLHIFVGGVTFEDGTINKTLTAADFNELGVATYFMVQGADVTASVCHTTAFYQGTERID